MRLPLIQQFEDYLRGQGLRLTAQRQLIVNAFSRQKGHVSAEELYRDIQKSTPSIGFATVYRTLKLLADAGFAAGKNFGDGFVRFECTFGRSIGHHDHLICSKCGLIVEFSNNSIEELQEEVAKKHGFSMKTHNLDIYGTCRTCSTSRPK